jgi:hypothetical protein
MPENRWNNYHYDMFTTTSLITTSTAAPRLPPHHVHSFRYGTSHFLGCACARCEQAFSMIAEGSPGCNSNSFVTRRGSTTCASPSSSRHLLSVPVLLYGHQFNKVPRSIQT